MKLERRHLISLNVAVTAGSAAAGSAWWVKTGSTGTGLGAFSFLMGAYLFGLFLIREWYSFPEKEKVAVSTRRIAELEAKVAELEARDEEREAQINHMERLFVSRLAFAWLNFPPETRQDPNFPSFTQFVDLRTTSWDGGMM